MHLPAGVSLFLIMAAIQCIVASAGASERVEEDRMNSSIHISRKGDSVRKRAVQTVVRKGSKGTKAPSSKGK